MIHETSVSAEMRRHHGGNAGNVAINGILKRLKNLSAASRTVSAERTRKILMTGRQKEPHLDWMFHSVCRQRDLSIAVQQPKYIYIKTRRLK
ncbi:MAG: hypothetical protein ACRD22_03605 [Terriglobia bacterium]